MSKNTKSSSTEIATLASYTLKSKNSSKIAQELAGSVLSQTNTKKETGSTLEEKASKVLKSKKYSEETRKLAASVLSQSNRER